MKTIFKKITIDGETIEIRKTLIGYSIYDGGKYVGWRLTLDDAKSYGDYLSGNF